MPELPEAETISSQIRPFIQNRKIIDVAVNRDRAIRRHASVEEFKSLILNATIITSSRRGKAILLPLDNNKTIVIRLGMSGSLYFKSADSAEELKKHTHVILMLDTGDELHYIDPRTFGEVLVEDGVDVSKFKIFEGYGYEPLSDEFDFRALLKLCKQKSGSIEALLMDQKNVVGIGKIYSDESLFLAEIDPRRAAKSITEKEAKKLVTEIKNVLSHSIEQRGTSGKDGAYRDAFFSHGTFATKLNVYQREGKACNRCGATIEFVPFQGRRMHFCPNCQK